MVRSYLVLVVILWILSVFSISYIRFPEQGCDTNLHNNQTDNNYNRNLHIHNTADINSAHTNETNTQLTQRTFTSGPPLNNKTHKKHKVFILTMPRSGSTFLGELFRQNEDFVYLFEVTRALAQGFHHDSCAANASKLAQGIIADIFCCNFTSLQQHLGGIAFKGGPEMSIWDHAVSKSSEKEKIQMCLPDTTGGLKGNMSVAIKEISFWGPKAQWLVNNLGPEVKILWLVRDVRGWVSSWLAQNYALRGRKDFNGTTSGGLYEIWGYNKRKMWNYYKGCDVIQKDTPFSPAHLKKLKNYLDKLNRMPHLRMAAFWMLETAVTKFYLENIPKQNFMLVHYEHLVLYPLHVSQQIYEFLGESITPASVLSWILKSTQEGDIEDRYGTSRNGQAMAEVWKKRMSEKQIREVEDLAEPMFDYFGFQRSIY